MMMRLKFKFKNFFYKKAKFELLKNNKEINLYAGDVPMSDKYSKFIGLSINRNNFNHIRHDITEKMPIDNNSVDMYQSEDVFEHIEVDKLPEIIDEIYRVLKPSSIFRLSLPDYRCDVLNQRCLKNEKGDLLFDPLGGGEYKDGRVINGGHLWFPVYESVKEILAKTKFKNINFYHYYDEKNVAHTNKIDYTVGYIIRVPDHDSRVQNPYRPMSIVVDCIK